MSSTTAPAGHALASTAVVPYLTIAFAPVLLTFSVGFAAVFAAVNLTAIRAPAASVNLSEFYTTTTGKYQFSFMTEADDVTLTNFFAGLSDLSLSQQVIYLCGMSPSPHGDFALVQVSDPKTVDTVKAIF